MLQMIENILVPVDFGSASLRALSTAVSIARMNRAQVHILHVRHETIKIDVPGPTHHLQAEEQLSRWLADAVQHTFELQPVCVQEEGTPHAVIRQWLQQNPCDLVVMGMYGRCADSSLQIGSTAYQVIKQNACPVLLMPATGIRNSFGRTLYATRPYTGSMAPLNFVKRLLPENAAIEILPCAVSSEKSGRNICTLLADEAREALENISLEWNSRWPQPEHTLANELMTASQQSEADLLVLTPSLGKVNRLGHVDPEIKDVLRNPLLPVLYLMNATLHRKQPRQQPILS